uniref:Uncharacterized protein n=1 Tax=Romanomermis culicivorax TaxID=13658 RepID=A0A915L983_ROMCU
MSENLNIEQRCVICCWMRQDVKATEIHQKLVDVYGAEDIISVLLTYLQILSQLQLHPPHEHLGPYSQSGVSGVLG